MKVLLLHPGASWSTADVEAGLRHGLIHYGVQVIPYRLDQRIDWSARWLNYMWRRKRKDDPTLAKPMPADILYQAGAYAVEMALRERVDAVVVVSAMYLHPKVLQLLKQARIPVAILFTESPYDLEKELQVAALVDGCWTNERSSVAAFREVNPNAGYLPHAWHPERHAPDVPVLDVPRHDVVFVGTGFAERIHWFNAIDWTGINLGLYGTWDDLGRSAKLKPQVRACVRGERVNNETAASLYRRATIGLNLYRRSKGFGKDAPQIRRADSLSPRAYELAACGVFHLSEYRAEVSEVFGDLVPTFETPTEAAALLRVWLSDAEGRARVSALLPAAVAEASWIHRATTVIGDLQRLLMTRAA